MSVGFTQSSHFSNSYYEFFFFNFKMAFNVFYYPPTYCARID